MKSFLSVNVSKKVRCNLEEKKVLSKFKVQGTWVSFASDMKVIIMEMLWTSVKWKSHSRHLMIKGLSLGLLDW